jgi:hypothetical protein
MSEHRDLERGPQGDHGQHGDTGATGATGPQGEPGSPWHWGLWPALRLLAYVLVVAACVYSVASVFEIARENKQTIERVEANQKRIDAEGIERRDQICLSAEREHLNSVNQLKRTYEYLNSLPDEAFVPSAANAINLAVLRQLPTTEDEANTDVAPEFCDVTLKGGKPVGLPEPDPIVPSRPERIDALVKKLQVQQDKRTTERIQESTGQDLRNADQRP